MVLVNFLLTAPSVCSPCCPSCNHLGLLNIETRTQALSECLHVRHCNISKLQPPLQRVLPLPALERLVSTRTTLLPHVPLPSLNRKSLLWLLPVVQASPRYACMTLKRWTIIRNAYDLSYQTKMPAADWAWPVRHISIRSPLERSTNLSNISQRLSWLCQDRKVVGFLSWDPILPSAI